MSEMSDFFLLDMKEFLRRLVGLDYADSVKLSGEQKRGLNLLYINGVFALFADAAIANFTNLFLVALKASNTQIGVLATLSQIFTALAPLPAAALTERTGQYKRNVILPNSIARIGFFLLAALPLLGVGSTAIWIAIAVFALRAFLVSWSVPPWTAFVGKLVPINIRAGFFSARNFASGISSMIGALLAGQLIGALGYPLGYQFVFVISALIGFGATFTFSRIPFQGQRRKNQEQKERNTDQSANSQNWSLIADFKSLPKEHPKFTRYLICSCALALGVGIGGPFIQVYQVRVLGFTAGFIGLLASIELLMNIVMQRVYGSFVMAKFGEFRVMRVLRFFTTFVPLFWVFVNSPALAVPIVMFAGAIWSGHELANFNTQLALTPETNRANYIALHTFAVSICAAVGPALGGALVDVIGFHPLFVVSGILRFLAGVLLAVVIKDI